MRNNDRVDILSCNFLTRYYADVITRSLKVSAETAMVFNRLDAKIVYHAVVFRPKTFPITNFPISVVKGTSPIAFVYRIFCQNFNIL